MVNVKSVYQRQPVQGALQGNKGHHEDADSPAHQLVGRYFLANIYKMGLIGEQKLDFAIENWWMYNYVLHATQNQSCACSSSLYTFLQNYHEYL